jgi:predicted DsbA family dithiol-disulfide isomerase
MIEVFGDIYCPFTHVSLRTLTARRRDEGRDFRLRVRAWPLELVNGEPLDPELVAREVEALRAQVDSSAFAAFDRERFPTTTLPALALASVAYERDMETGERVSLLLRSALFEDGRDIADRAVLEELAAAHGVEPPTDRHLALVGAEWEAGRGRGVEGSPHYFIGSWSRFSPTLDVREVDGRFDVSVHAAGLEELFGQL